MHRKQLLTLLALPLAGCINASSHQSGPAGEVPIIEGPLLKLEVKTGDNSREGGGGFNVPTHAKLYRDYLIVTYEPGTAKERHQVIPAERVWELEIGPRARP